MIITTQITNPELPIYGGVGYMKARQGLFINGSVYPWLTNQTPDEVRYALSRGSIKEGVAFQRASTDRLPFLDTYQGPLYGQPWSSEINYLSEAYPVVLSLMGGNDSLASARLCLVSDSSPHILARDGNFVCLGDNKGTNGKAELEILLNEKPSLNLLKRVQYVAYTEAGKALLSFAKRQEGTTLSLERLTSHCNNQRLAALSLPLFVKQMIINCPENVSGIVGYITKGSLVHRMLEALSIPWEKANWDPSLDFCGEILTLDAKFDGEGNIISKSVSETVLFTLDVRGTQSFVSLLKEREPNINKDDPRFDLMRALKTAENFINRNN